MKKHILTVSCLCLLLSCGPSAEEKARMEQASQDSIRALEDAMRAAQEQAAAAAAAASMDSVKADTSSLQGKDVKTTSDH